MLRNLDIFLILTFCLVFTGCSSSSRKPAYDRGPSTSKLILDEDKDTLIITPNIKNENSNKLVIYLPGSSGPTTYTVSQAFSIAKSGYQVIHLCWYNCNKNEYDDMDAIRLIDLKLISEKIQKILEKLEYQQMNISLVGISREAEAVSLLISHPEILKFNVNKAVLIAGISITADSRESISKEEVNQRSLGAGNRNEKIDQDSYKIPSWLIGANEIPNREVIDVNNFKNPLLIIHGELDPVWSSKYAFEFQKSYERNGLKTYVEIIPKEGHIFPREGGLASVRMIKFLGQ
jgi:dienelactone hydrolase